MLGKSMPKANTKKRKSERAFDDTVFKAVRIMTATEIGRLPVVSTDDSKQLVKIITRSDIGATIAEKHKVSF